MVIVVLACAVSSVCMYFFGPRKVKYKESVRVVEKVVTVVKSDVKTKRVIETKPDGSTKTTETIEDKSVRSDEADKTETKTVSKTVKPQAGTTVFGGIGIGQRQYVAGVQKDIFGPFGIWAMGSFDQERRSVGGFFGLSIKF